MHARLSVPKITSIPSEPSTRGILRCIQQYAQKKNVTFAAARTYFQRGRLTSYRACAATPPHRAASRCVTSDIIFVIPVGRVGLKKQKKDAQNKLRNMHVCLATTLSVVEKSESRHTEANSMQPNTHRCAVSFRRPSRMSRPGLARSLRP